MEMPDLKPIQPPRQGSKTAHPVWRSGVHGAGVPVRNDGEHSGVALSQTAQTSDFFSNLRVIQ